MALSIDEQQVRDVLRKHPDKHLSPTVIGQSLGKSCSWASSVCIPMATRGLLNRNDAGHYMLLRHIDASRQPQRFVHGFKLQSKEHRISVESEYHPQVAAKVSTLRGEWDGGNKVWWFDARDEHRAVAIYESIFGRMSDPMVTLQICADYFMGSENSPPYAMFVAGRKVVTLRKSDGEAKLGFGVVLTSGKFQDGGSSNARRLVTRPGTTVLIRDIPLGKAEQVVLENAEHAQIVDEPKQTQPLEFHEQEELSQRSAALNTLIELSTQLSALSERVGSAIGALKSSMKLD